MEIAPGALEFTPKGDKRFNALDVAILPVDAAGRTHGLTQGHPQLTLAPALADDRVAKGLRLSHRLTLPPGDYQLRIGVREIGGGAAGSVLCDLVVPDPSVPGLAMTPIVASASSAMTVPSAYNDPGLLWALGGPPTTARAFDRTDTLSAYVELVEPAPPRSATSISSPWSATRAAATSSAARSPRPTAGSPRAELRLRRRPATEGARARPLRAPDRSPCQRAGGAAGARARLRREEPRSMKRLVLTLRAGRARLRGRRPGRAAAGPPPVAQGRPCARRSIRSWWMSWSPTPTARSSRPDRRRLRGSRARPGADGRRRSPRWPSPRSPAAWTEAPLPATSARTRVSGMPGSSSWSSTTPTSLST